MYCKGRVRYSEALRGAVYTAHTYDTRMITHMTHMIYTHMNIGTAGAEITV